MWHLGQGARSPPLAGLQLHFAPAPWAGQTSWPCSQFSTASCRWCTRPRPGYQRSACSSPRPRPASCPLWSARPTWPAPPLPAIPRRDGDRAARDHGRRTAPPPRGAGTSLSQQRNGRGAPVSRRAAAGSDESSVCGLLSVRDMLLSKRGGQEQTPRPFQGLSRSRSWAGR